MAGSFNDFLETALLNHVLRNTAFTSPVTVYAALFTVAPTDAGGGTEVATGSYARVAITFGAAVSGSPSSITNSADVDFPTATANWGTIVAAAVFDAVTVGNMLLWGDLTVSKAVNNGTQARFLTGDIVVTQD